MGIAVHELLTLEYCRDFEVIAGKGGLSKEIQGVTVLEAPDGYNWAKGKELVLSSGYVMTQDPDCLARAFAQGSIQQTSGLIIKRDRYLNQIPQSMKDLFDEHDVPLILMPFAISWMDLMNQINVAVLNQTIRRFQIHSPSSFQMSNMSYKDQKIKKILQTVEIEMHFPAALYDMTSGKNYYSSANFQRITESFGLEERDYWAPSKPYTKYTLCDYINMSRYRLVNPNGIEGPRISWIIIPVMVNGICQGYFVVMESREFIDYYDEYSIRIAYLLIQALYEQISLVQNIGNLGFENFVHYALSYEEKDKTKLIAQASSLGFSMANSYSCILFQSSGSKVSLRSIRKQLMDTFNQQRGSQKGWLALLDEKEGIMLFDREQNEEESPESRKATLESFIQALQKKCADVQLEFAINTDMKSLVDIRYSVDKCRKVMDVGKKILPRDQIWDSEVLGPLIWVQIPEEELEELVAVYRTMMHDEKNLDLIRTLKVYLENNMNYSITAEKMYVHINTVRKRIDKVNAVLNIDWNSHIERIKAYLLLQFLELS
ncbi:MAG: PucR family transcriptional regulator ligand-binding domain-containing protein [Dorea sp.]|nr:PucR family transcriptional regulator ligand-binding domain-containing protein [Dorea sp.]